MSFVADIVPRVRDHTDTDEAYLYRLAEFCATAHRQLPGGCSIEIGTRMGGSAAVIAAAMLDTYGDAWKCPPLLTCDPYGCRPYNDGRGVFGTDYGRVNYLTMKHVLANVAFHAHFRLPSRTFLALIQTAEWWEDGTAVPMRRVSFAFLDGEHDAASILMEARTMLNGMLPGGIIVVDNVDHDPASIPGLRALGDVMLQGPWAILTPREG